MYSRVPNCYWWLLLIVRLGGSASCLDDPGCVAACVAAVGANAPCARSVCDGTYQRCACGDEAALLTNGGCEAAPPITIGGCQLAYRAHILTATPASPELRPQDVSAEGGRPSAALVTMFRRSLAAGLGRGAHEVVAMNVLLWQPAAGSFDRLSGYLAVGGHVVADVKFDFCMGHPELELHKLGSAMFDRGFDMEAQRYAALHMGTVRVMRITSNVSTTTTTRTTLPPMLHTSDQGEQSVFARLWWIWWLLIIPLAAALVVVWLVFRRRSTKQAPSPITPFVPLDGPPLHLPAGPLLATLPRVCAHVAFRPEQIQEADSTVRCIPLKEGDMLEVMLNAGEWLYGRHLNTDGNGCADAASEEAGYFPENHVSWLGRPVPDEVAMAGAVGTRVEPETIGLTAADTSGLRAIGRPPGDDLTVVDVVAGTATPVPGTPRGEEQAVSRPAASWSHGVEVDAETATPVPGATPRREQQELPATDMPGAMPTGTPIATPRDTAKSSKEVSAPRDPQGLPSNPDETQPRLAGGHSARFPSFSVDLAFAPPAPTSGLRPSQLLVEPPQEAPADFSVAMSDQAAAANLHQSASFSELGLDCRPASAEGAADDKRQVLQNSPSFGLDDEVMAVD